MNREELLKKSFDKAEEFYNNMAFETKWDFQCALGKSSLTKEDLKILITGCFEEGYIKGYVDKYEETK